MKIKTYFDKNLRERPEVPSELQEQLCSLKSRLDQILCPKEKAKCFGEIGICHKLMEQYDEAIQAFQEAIEKGAELRSLAADLHIRLADTYRLKGDFQTALGIFNEILKERQEWRSLEDFYLQHLGKLYFDQKRYAEALSAFQSAWVLRERKGELELLQSTEIAIQETLKRMEG